MGAALYLIVPPLANSSSGATADTGFTASVYIEKAVRVGGSGCPGARRQHEVGDHATAPVGDTPLTDEAIG